MQNLKAKLENDKATDLDFFIEQSNIVIVKRQKTI